MSVDSISDMVESQSRLLEALQLSHPNELELKKAAGRTQAKLSLNPIYRQVPRVVERCCNHIETYGELQTLRNMSSYFILKLTQEVELKFEMDWLAGKELQLKVDWNGREMSLFQDNSHCSVGHGYLYV